MRDLIAGLSLENIIIAGWSLGGIVAQVVLATVPAKFSHAVLLATTPAGPLVKPSEQVFYDQAFIAVADAQAEASLRVTSLPVSQASLGHRGYTREVSPDGRQPLIYDYDYVDPAPLARMAGKLTRYGDVARLLQAADDLLW